MSNYIYLKDELTGKYKEAFEKVEIYSDMRNVDYDTHKEMMMNLLDMLLTAQKEGKPVEKIVGKDIKLFCKNYFSGYGWKNYLCNIPKQIYRAMWVVFVFSLIEVLVEMREHGRNLYSATTNVTGYLLGFFGGMVITLLLNIIVQPIVFRRGKFSSNAYAGLCVCCMLLMIFGGGTLLGDRELNVRLFPLLVVSGGYVIGYIVFRAVWRYHHYGTVRKPKEPYEELFGERIMDSVERDLPMEIVKKYEKKNRKRAKRGKKIMTPQEYMEKMHKENMATEWIDRITVIIIAGLCISNGVSEGISNNVLSGLTMGAVLLLCEIPVLLFIRFLNKGLKVREKILEECKQQGIDILEYAEMRQKDIVKDEEE